MPKSKIKSERISIYFDCICGVISSTISLTGIFYVVINYGIYDPGWFTVGLIFLIGYLLFAIFLIFLGIYGYYQEKKYGTKEYKKKLKAPIVS